MREVDRAMVEDYRIELIQMMENAGRVLASLARSRFLGGDVFDRSVLVLCGTGNNGGGGLVCARRLHCWGARVRVITTKSQEDYLGVPEHQLDIVDRLGIPITDMHGPTVLSEVDLIVDAIIGYGLSGPPRDNAARLIRLGNEYGSPVLSLDAPSGLDVSKGTALEPTMRATATLTLAIPKVGLRTPEATEYVGELYLGDISVPPELFAGHGLAYDVGPIFAREEVVRI
jgi:NAD(P)H-hydrate epimerase